MKSISKWMVFSLLCVLLFFAGYVTNEIFDRHEYGFHTLPNVPRLPAKAPEIFKGYQKDAGFGDLNMSDFRRIDWLNDFYDAWKRKETLGLYEIGWGLDDLIHMYWLTTDGKVYCFCISDHGTFRIPKTYLLDESEDVSIRCFWEGNDDHECYDPNAIDDCFPILDGGFKQENRRFL